MKVTKYIINDLACFDHSQQILDQIHSLVYKMHMRWFWLLSYR